MEYLTSGITANFDMYFFPESNAKASIDCGFRTVQTSGFNNFSSSLEELEEDYYRVNEMGELASFILGFHAEYTTSRDRMEGLAVSANKVKSPVFLHNAETALEVKECKERWGMTPTGLTDALGMYTYGGGGYHCIHMEDGDFEIFKKRQLTAVTNPASNLKLASALHRSSVIWMRGSRLPSEQMVRQAIIVWICSGKCSLHNSTCQGKGAGCGLCPGRRGTLYGNGGRRAVYGTGGLR